MSATPNQLISYQKPLYEQVYQVLKGRILAGEWEQRAPLPGEAHLSRDMGVSVGTVRKAMDQLAREGMIIRGRGRGTFACQAGKCRTMSITRLCDEHGMSIVTQIRIVEVVESSPTIGERDALRRGAALASILRFRREWTHAGKVVCWETIVVEPTRFPKLETLIDDSAETFFGAYAEVYRTRVDRLQWAVGGGLARNCGRRTRAGTPSLSIRRTAFDAQGSVLEVCEQHVLTDAYGIEIIADAPSLSYSP